MSERPTSGPAPRWGEYAPVREPVAAPEPEQVREPDPVAPAPSIASDGTTRPVRRWDRVLTIALLAFGVVNVITGIPAMLDLPETLSIMYSASGYGRYTSDSLATGVGIAINISQVVLLIVTVMLATASLRANRISFWIPLTAGVVSGILLIVLLAVAMFGDPALAAYLDQQIQSSAPPAAPAG